VTRTSDSGPRNSGPTPGIQVSAKRSTAMQV